MFFFAIFEKKCHGNFPMAILPWQNYKKGWICLWSGHGQVFFHGEWLFANAFSMAEKDRKTKQINFESN